MEYGYLLFTTHSPEINFAANTLIIQRMQLYFVKIALQIK